MLANKRYWMIGLVVSRSVTTSGTISIEVQPKGNDKGEERERDIKSKIKRHYL